MLCSVAKMVFVCNRVKAQSGTITCLYTSVTFFCSPGILSFLLTFSGPPLTASSREPSDGVLQARCLGLLIPSGYVFCRTANTPLKYEP